MAELRYNHAVNRAMADAMAADPTVVLFGEDVAGAGGVYGATRGLRDRFLRPERVRDTRRFPRRRSSAWRWGRLCPA